jgi:hypothetical protein
MNEPMLIHSVYFWFKPDAAPAVVQEFEAGLRRLASISEVQQAHFGRPAATPKRDVIDDTYAWGLVAVFADLEAHDRYQDHPLHQDFLRDFAASWQQVRVYDMTV